MYEFRVLGFVVCESGVEGLDLLGSLFRNRPY